MASTMKIILAQPRGFCAGVKRAIGIVDNALKKFGPPVYVLHEIVHNRHVVEALRAKGAVFVECLDEIPSPAVTIFSAHGVSTSVFREAEAKGLRIINATCPIINKIHAEVMQYSQQGYEIIIIGHAGHPEVEGMRGRIDSAVHIIASVEEVERLEVNDPEHVTYITQTTLGVEKTQRIIAALKKRFSIQRPKASNICYATEARQNSVRDLAASIDLLLVVGARNSSNSNRLREIGEQNGVASHLIDGPDDLDPLWFGRDSRVGITAGASAPEEVVLMVIDRLRSFHPCTISELPGAVETSIPRQDKQASGNFNLPRRGMIGD